MSLKAKLEAVIYAAEEPVTLTQLAILFADEALEWKTEQESAENRQASVTAGAGTMPLLNDEFSYLEADSEAAPAGEEKEPGAAEPAEDSGPAVEPEATSAQGLTAEPEPLAELESAAEAAPEPIQEPAIAAEGLTAEPAADTAVPQAENLPATETAGAAPAEESPAAAELEAKRLARQRDREVRGVLRLILDELIDDYVSDERGIEIREIAGGYRMATKPECHDAVRAFVKSLKPPLKLSLPALETLAVIAYKQPITAPEVNEIRGVDSSGVFGSLLARKLIATAGRKQVIGRPILYKTTREFLLRFGLKDVSELPSMEEFEKMAAIELEEPDTANDRQDGAETSATPSGPEFDENASEDTADETVDAPAETPAPEPAAAAEAAEPFSEPVSEAVVETPAEDAIDATPAEATAEPASTPTEADNTAVEAETEAESTRA